MAKQLRGEFLGPISLRDVVNDGQHVRAAAIVLGCYGTQGQFYSDFLPSLGYRGQAKKTVGVYVGAPPARLVVTGHPRLMLGLETFWHQILDTHLVKRLGGRVPKDASCRPILEDYALGLYSRDDDPVADHLKELGES